MVKKKNSLLKIIKIFTINTILLKNILDLILKWLKLMLNNNLIN